MAFRIAVSPLGYDDMGSVLTQMGYAFDNISHDQLGDKELLAKYDAVFINCSSSCRRHARHGASALRDYVASGGSLYASDFAADYLALAFPEYITFRAGGQAGTLDAWVEDPGLRADLGPILKLTFDLADWRQVQTIDRHAELHLTANRVPLLVSFRHGQGQVVFTSFHNQAQVSEKEQRVLRFLVLKPLLARAQSAINMLAPKTQGTIESTGVLSAGQEPVSYHYTSEGTRGLRFLLGWEGSTARLSLAVLRPNGILFAQAEGTQPPLQIVVPTAGAGLWQYQVKALSVPYANFPFVVMAGPATPAGTREPDTSSTEISATPTNLPASDGITILPDRTDAHEDGLEDLDITIVSQPH